MKKVALVFALAVFVPSLALAWLAVLSLRDQQFVLERQRSLLYQEITDRLALQAGTLLTDYQHQFGTHVEEMLEGSSPGDVARAFNEQLRTNWSFADVGFVVTATGAILS